ncbi:MAG: hypothetical protein K6G12_07890 [Lachnospiraceae bacterium]|nr:hypothetical protein [Lachnospiraceae bacterium]
METNGTSFTELQIGEQIMDKSYKNPLTKTYQYEYALYETVSELFGSTSCKSKLIDTLKLYFKELPAGQSGAVSTDRNEDIGKEPKKITQESIMREVRLLVERDVAGQVSFPGMHECKAKVTVMSNKNGTHAFLFSDGFYTFAVHIEVPGKGHPKKILKKVLKI